MNKLTGADTASESLQTNSTELVECRLGDLIQLGNGKTRPTSPGEVPIYGGNGILGYGGHANYDGPLIVIGRVGAYCGSVFYETRPIWVSDNALAAHAKGSNNAKYLYYFLKNINLNQLAQGSSHPLVTQTLLNSVSIEILPNSDEQAAIARNLSSLDEKIELLSRQNQTLEAMAETQFRQWFLEAADARWGEYRVNDFADHIKLGIQPGNDPSTEFLHYSLPAFDAGQRPSVVLGSQILSNKFKVAEGVLLVSKLNPRVSRVWPVDRLPEGANAICSTEFQVLKPRKPAWFGFLFGLLTSSDARDSLTMAASGTSGSHQRVRPEDILAIKTTLPSIELAEEFSHWVEPLMSKRQRNIEQIAALERLRDNLLPKLMSGEVRVAC